MAGRLVIGNAALQIVCLLGVFGTIVGARVFFFYCLSNCRNFLSSSITEQGTEGIAKSIIKRSIDRDYNF